MGSNMLYLLRLSREVPGLLLQRNCLVLVSVVISVTGLYMSRIERLPGGLDAKLEKKVYPEAVELSGGETQRLMMARMLYKDAPVILLDEPTAALDALAEQDIYERYNELTRGRTSVYISHRLASTRFCDRVILLEDGGIREEGTHEQLLALGGRYAELFQVQSKYYREEGVREDA